MDRRDFLLAASATGALLLGARSGRAAPADAGVLDEQELLLDGDKRLARRALVLLPRDRAPGSPLPLLVLLHGLGETGNEHLGARAWADLYGLVRCYERLCRPPIQRTLGYGNYLTDEHAKVLNDSLEAQPFSGMALVCPVTPNVYKLPPTARTLTRYAAWLEDVLLPAVRAEFPVAHDREHTAIDGCSLGGYVSLEVFMRKPQLFGNVGAVQGAIGVSRAHTYAERLRDAIAAGKGTKIRLGTSSGDPYREAHEHLSKKLSALGLPSTLEVLPGPHSQPWLREVGTLTMLLWHERALARHC